MCRGTSLTASIDFDKLPVFPAARRLVQEGIGTGASKRNWASYDEAVELPAETLSWQRDLLCDPQTSGGLLIACAPEVVPAAFDLLYRRGFEHTAEICGFKTGPAGIRVAL